VTFAFERVYYLPLVNWILVKFDHHLEAPDISFQQFSSLTKGN
jgi:hypothetical protein